MQGQIDPTATLAKAIPIKVLAKEIPGRNGRSLHWMTLGRWCRPSGLRGIVLPSVIIGNQRCVDRDDLARFIEAVTRAADGERPVRAIATRTRREKNKAIRDSIAELAAAGA